MIHQEDDLEVRLNNADQALYTAKNSGRNRCERYQPSHEKLTQA